ncbi:hypothetical protein EC957_009298 [Mortierella hygrophila]|uniref:Uncharacterized protein n=1 Tax=Mortierella hygrophila TaxID=979708 RepID=A0A9P6K4R2_9FUNG|nr:hypothetical protein EC957_009298 [Mortierella hygrophila]
MSSTCPEFRLLTLTGTQKPWTGSMIKGMPDAVEELFLKTSKLGVFRVKRAHLPQSHGDDGTFKEVMFRGQWGLPCLRKLHLSGMLPRANGQETVYIPIPIEWRQEYRAHENGVRSQALAFDAALLNHLKDLRSPSKVAVTETAYHKKLE